MVNEKGERTTTKKEAFMANLGNTLLAANRKADIRITAHDFSYIVSS